MNRPTSARFVPATFAVAFLALASSAPAVPLGTPTFVYSNAVNSTPGNLSAPADPRNSVSRFQVYWDVDTEQRVEMVGLPLIYTNSPHSWVVDTGDSNRYSRAMNTADPRTLDATSVNQARSFGGHPAYANTGAVARSWYVLSGGVGTAHLRADAVLQGQLGASGLDSVTHFTNQLGVLSQPDDLSIDNVVVTNGTTDPSCGPFGQASTFDDQCFAADGNLHDINLVMRSNPFAVTFDVPFRLSMGIGTNAATTDGWAVSDFSDPRLATLSDFAELTQLTSEGFVLDLDGNWQTTDDVVRLGQFDYTLRAIPEPSSLVLAVLGLLTLGVFARRRRRRATP